MVASHPKIGERLYRLGKVELKRSSDLLGGLEL